MASTSSELGEVVRRYVTALFEVADEAQAIEPVTQDFLNLSDMIADSEDLRRLARSPRLGRQEQAAALAEISQRAGFNPVTRNFLGVMAANRRLFVLEETVARFLAEVARRRGEVVADVTSALKLTQKQARSLADQLSAALNARVTLRAAVDPEILGGLIVKVGSRLVDTSIRSKLQRLQLAMKGT